MCGVAGFAHKNSCTDLCLDLSKKIHELQACRGPDNQTTTTYSGKSWTAHFYHQHLRVVDLNPLANQPMRSKMDSSLSIILNGEIYNHSELKSQLKYKPSTRSDTEVLVEMLAQFGSKETLKKIRGMFAWATINERTSELEIVRDRFGEKPLHLVKNPDSFFFSSQYDSSILFIKKFKSLNIDQDSLSSYLSLGYVPYRNSLFAGIEKVSPGGKITLNMTANDWSGIKQDRWVTPFEVSNTRNYTPDQLEEVIRSSVREQLEADVPVGLFLSGGVDSSLISALAQQEHTQPMHSFSIGFENTEFDESKYALEISKSLGTKHHSRTMTSQDALSIIGKVENAYSEPLADPSVFPTTFVSEFAREYVTVCLTGDGADELFFGYGRYDRYQFLENSLSLPSIKVLGKFALKSPSLIRFLGSGGARLKGLLESKSSLEMYLPLVGFQHLSQPISSFSVSAKKGIAEKYIRTKISGPSLNWMREFDLDTYLTDDILLKVDRAAMASSLETRAPFLDPRVVQIAQELQREGLVSPSQKAILKSIITKYAPTGNFDRKKQGFGAPLGDWFRGSLREWGSSIIQDTDWNSLGLLELEINSIWTDLLRGTKSDATFEWLLLSLGSSIRGAKKL